VDFQLTEDQLLVQKTAREFAQEEVLPKAAEIDREHRHPKELVARMAELGFLGVAVPDEFGGAGLDHVSYVLVMEEVSRACASTGVIMSVNNSLVCDPINRFGTEAQKKQWLTPLAQGKKLGCFALSEPEAGSDAAAQRTTATRQSDGSWVISGTKNWITNGPVADVCVLFTMNDRPAGHKGITAFILPMDAKGVRCGAPDDKLGIRGSKSSQIFLDDVVLSADHVLGEVGGGFKVAMSTLDGGRIGIAAQAIGIAQAAFEEALAYSQQREQFGQPLSNFQAIQFYLADMSTEIDAARLLTWKAAWAKEGRKRYSLEAAQAKLFASEMAQRVTNKALQIHGGYGYTKEYNVERYFRDARITEIYEGTSEIQKMVIADWVLNKA
jgi:butyryl-CoA dehydrogenase